MTDAFVEAIASQRRAATPGRSAFVMANAGAGKTRVLTNRVARLLLADADPAQIICITFTKAAAAEMAERLFDMLGKWALADDETLSTDLRELEGEAYYQRSDAALRRTRQLFARALETPGGLKIQTIHAFCESVLRRFPLEAGVSPGFTVVEDGDAIKLLNTAISQLTRKSGDIDADNDFERLAARFSEDDLRAHIRASVPDLQFSDAASFDPHALSRALGVQPEDTRSAIIDAFLNSLNPQDIDRAATALTESGGNPAKLAPSLKEVSAKGDRTRQWAAAEKVFLTTSRTPRSKLSTKATDKIDPWARPFLDAMQADFLAALERLKAAEIYHDTVAFERIRRRVFAFYQQEKHRRASLDFDDLIARTIHLLTKNATSWIMYKLDNGVDHVLVDEAQDTSPRQWRVIEALIADWLSGDSARAAARSFFAVGDLKQSIYSFQGADADVFQEKERDLGKRLGVVARYENVPLSLSFRTTKPVLHFVDEVFSDPEAAEGLGDAADIHHDLFRQGEYGCVELWPLTPSNDRDDVKPWDAPIDAVSDDHPTIALAKRIAQTIKSWIDGGRILKSEGRPIEPRDILILVQSRSVLFREINQRLATAGVPLAGADRLLLNDDPAIEDIMSFANFALNRSDDLSLAEVLKSPLFGFEDDADIFPLAYERERSESLWSSLKRRSGERDHWRKAADEIDDICATAAPMGPYAFINAILTAGETSGRRRFYERMTNAAGDPINELLRQTLDFENSAPRSLRAFVAWLAKNASEVKREMDTEKNAVRIMTVHGAKGLESNIVFLADAHRGPNYARGTPVYEIEGEGDQSATTVFCASTDLNTASIETARERRKRRAFEEYRRLFYVAATRAREELYICGVARKNAKRPEETPVTEYSWHALSTAAFDRLADQIESDTERFWETSGPVKRIVATQTQAVSRPPVQEITHKIETPGWPHNTAPRESGMKRISPSQFAGETYAPEGKFSGAAYTPLSDKYQRGRAIHRLLELLPDVDADKQNNIADAILERFAPNVSKIERAQWRQEALSIMVDPIFAPAFARNSRAEVNLAGAPRSLNGAIQIAGQIDRMAVFNQDVLIIDYKTNRPPPEDVRDVDIAYVAQLAGYRALVQEIYPKHKVRSAIIWTYAARLMEIPDDILDHAFERIYQSA